jgi:hypothetical protein
MPSPIDRTNSSSVSRAELTTSSEEIKTHSFVRLAARGHGQ